MRPRFGPRFRTGIAVVLLGICTAYGFAQMRPSRVSARYEGEMQDPVEDPADAHRKGEFALGRLRYHSPMDGGFAPYFRWGIDANKGDRLFISLLARLTRIDTQPVETIINAGDEEIFNHPFVFAVSVGDWRLTPAEANVLRQYLERGGFLMVDDFHNEREWALFMNGMRMINPAIESVELEDQDPAFNGVFTLKERIRVPGANVVHGSGIERGGTVPYWRAIRDPKGRMIVAITFNQDIGDGWEFADDPQYPERFSSQAIRIGINYVIYAITH